MRSARTFLTRGLLFAISLVLILVAGEGISRGMYGQKSPLGFHLAALEDRLEQVEVLAFGNSHMANGIDPLYLSMPGFNLAFPSQDLYYDSRLLIKYVDRAPHLQFAVISVDYYTIGYDQSRRSLHLARAYQDVAGIRPRNPYDIAFAASGLTLIRHRERFLSDLVTGARPVPPQVVAAGERPDPSFPGMVLYTSGFSPSSDSGNLGNGKTRARIHTNQYDADVRDQNLEILRDMIDRCADRGVRVLLVTPPYTDGYRLSFKAEIVSAFYESIGQIIAVSDPEHIRYYDFSSSGLFPPRMFANADHLTPEGAAAFTRTLDVLISDWSSPDGSASVARVRPESAASTQAPR